MPELPEVETTLRGVSPHICGKKLSGCVIRQAQLRWPIDLQLHKKIEGQTLHNITRRGKYLLFDFGATTALWHLGMSGSMRIIKDQTPPLKHDHVDWIFNQDTILRFHDPRRFGALVLTQAPATEHKLLAHLGPEPLSDAFDPEYLFTKSRKRKQAAKTWIMDAKLVVGVGNIYANEALFNSGIHPLKAAGKLTKAQCKKFCEEIKRVLAFAIEQGGTTLRDFVGGDGKPGYFAQSLNVYGRGGEPCKRCSKPLTEKHLSQRSTVYCTQCQS